MEKKSSRRDCEQETITFTSDQQVAAGSGLPLARAIAGSGYRGLTEADSAVVGRNSRVRENAKAIALESAHGAAQ